MARAYQRGQGGGTIVEVVDFERNGPSIKTLIFKKCQFKAL